MSRFLLSSLQFSATLLRDRQDFRFFPTGDTLDFKRFKNVIRKGDDSIQVRATDALRAAGYHYLLLPLFICLRHGCFKADRLSGAIP